jgi:ligand-binding SRPBCC domain-containing protein
LAISLRFESTLKSDPSQVWRWITDVRCLRREMRPWLWMSIPFGVRNLEDLDIQPGEPLFTSWLWLFGLLPLGVSKLTLLELTHGVGFIEQSPMTGTRLWRHERRLESAENGGTRVIDQLTVEPLLAAWLVRGFLRLFFASRHRALRARDRKQLH